MPDTEGRAVVPHHGRVRSQALLLTLLGRHVLDRGVAVSSGTFIEVLGSMGVGEFAVRSALTRMVQRGFLERHRRGRRTYLGLTGRSVDLLTEGRERIFGTDPGARHGNGSWTLLSFSIPEVRRSDRHRLRVRLAWDGFGLLRDGLWLAPGAVDVTRLVDELDLADHVEVFVGHAVRPTRVEAVIADAWDLDAVREGYRQFVARWDRRRPMPEAADDLARQLWLITDWRLLLREDPVLPVEHLSAGWPGLRAHAVFHRLHARVSSGAERRFDEMLDGIDPSTA